MPARTMMPTSKKRTALLALMVATGASLAPQATSSVSACCLTDWMYGRQPVVAAAPLPITNGTSVPYTATYTPYTAGYTPLIAPPVSTSVISNRPVLASAGPSVYSPTPAYSVQRPAYGAVPLNNPSVYTGMPVASGYRGSSSPNAAFMGTGNVYPNNYASPTSSVTAMRPAYAVPPTQQFATPIRSGLSRFFGSLLGTGYRSSYYTAPITYYRPATTIDPMTGTTITTQQACSSTVQQLQRTPLATYAPFSDSNAMPGGIAPCGASDCGSDSSFGYGVSPIPSTMTPSTMSPSMISPSGSGGYGDSGFGNPPGGNADLQPLSPPTLPPANFSARPDLSVPYPQSTPSFSDSYDSGFSGPSSNMSPLTGQRSDYESEFRRSEFDDSRSSSNQYTPFSTDDIPSASDRAPLEAPSLNSARPAIPETDAEDAYRRGYEAARLEMLERERQQQELDRIESERPPVRSQYQLDPPANSRQSTESSTEEPVQRSRYEIERDQRDLRDLTTRNENASPQAWHRVRPIPAPENYRNPFDAAKQPVSQPELTPPSYQSPAVPRSAVNEGLRAPDLLPPLPSPSSQFQNGYQRPTRYGSETRLSVPVREASMQSLEVSPKPTPQPKSANAWQEEVRRQTQESGWYAK